MEASLHRMRIHFYGVQGSGSTFPSVKETNDLQDLMDYETLKRIFEDIASHIHDGNRLDQSLIDLLNGPPNKKTLLAYRDRMKVPKPRIYGGWTTCIHVETSDGHDLVFDCGSGFRNCAKDLQLKWENREERHLHLFGSHSHNDHTEGFEQAAVCFDARNTITIYGNYPFLYALDSYLGVFSKHVRDDLIGIHTPINYNIMPAEFKGVELCPPDRPPPDEEERLMVRSVHSVNESLRIGRSLITAFEVCHPAPCLAYKVEYNGKKFVFCTDHELRRGKDPDHPTQKKSEAAEALLMDHAMDADVLYRDAQYLQSDYDGFSGIGSSNPISRLDWGHSCIEDVEQMARKCRVKRSYLGHHDPNREWSELNWIDEALAQRSENSDYAIELARAGTVINL
jgi:ribonuclease BN (tRNA processing enzyme)